MENLERARAAQLADQPGADAAQLAGPGLPLTRGHRIPRHLALVPLRPGRPDRL